MLNENCCAVPVEGIGSKAKSVSELLETALIDAEGIESFLFTKESTETDRKPPAAKCLDDELCLIREKAATLAGVLSNIRGRL